MSDKLFDKRLIERNLRKGLVTAEEHKKHLDGLPDRTESMIRLGDVEPTDDDVLSRVEEDEEEEPTEVEAGDEDEDEDDEEDEEDDEDDEEDEDEED
ncbi:MAG: hypothetical protein IT379_09130 [Deltaproteobacteria bacterium]|nr:hypothetical protein [Deltaproteobacteria bacterium]